MLIALFRLHRLTSYLLYTGLGAFTTFFILSIVAAFANIPNYAAKLAGQNCHCKVPSERVLYVDFGGLMLGMGVVHTNNYLSATIYLVAS